MFVQISAPLRLRLGWLAIALATLNAGLASAATLAEAQKLYRTGKYADCITAAEGGVSATPWQEEWWLLKLKAELTTGKYPQALSTYQSALSRHPGSLPIRFMGHDVLRFNNRQEEAKALLAIIRTLVVRSPGQYRSAADRVVLGRSLVMAGADARQVLELFYDSAKKDEPDSPDAYLASGELALEKQDYALAAEAFADAAKRAPDDPDAQLGLARAFENDSERATAALNKALELNPKHVESLLYQIDNLIDQEGYTDAEKILAEVLEINPSNSDAWAFRAVLAHLAGDSALELGHREQALKTWPTNPDVDHLIGQKISRKYRFAEGASYQRRALVLSPGYKPATLQLCQDLLRLGKEEEGWQLAADAFKQDAYDVVAYNLVTLHDNLDKFVTLKNDDFVVRMDPREAKIYGERVLRLLDRAKATLSAKYGVTLPQATSVEVFPQQKDFAIRTFGLPGGAGYLGVCFGPVITVNSPASRAASPANWEAILWHEFCHAVTLHKTKNKMPRWLSEGISVHEEREMNRAWGQAMTAEYREMILEDQATPVSKLSGAFLKPATPMHLNFAYYESSMVVQYILDRFGAAAMQKILTDLGDDVPINKALAAHTEPIEKLDESFAKWLRTQAEQLAPKADLTRPKQLPLDADSAAMAAWNKDHPDNFWGLVGEGRALLAERKWEQAKAPLERAAALYPTYKSPGGPFLLLASAHRELKQFDVEREMLQKYVALSDSAIEPRLRLMEICAEQKDWAAVRAVAEQVLAINPLVPAPHRQLLRAAEELKDRPLAIESHQTLLLMNPLDPADHHYRLAGLLMEDQKLPEAKRQAVLALEQAPRFLAAHRLLLELVSKVPPEPAPPRPFPAAAMPATRSARDRSNP